MPIRTVNIIGAGVSGLSAGIYLQMNGFQTEIFEKHNIPGGLCTGWRKGDYWIDGCAQWILGSDTGSGFHKIWNELIDTSSMSWVNHEVRMSLELKSSRDRYGGNVFHFFTNLRRLEDYMVDLSPDDAAAIRQFTGYVREVQKYDLPPVPEDLPLMPSMIRGLKMARYAGFGWLYLQVMRQTNLTFARQFRSPFLREAFEMIYDGVEVNLMVLLFPMACFDRKSAGYPIGGSFALAKKLEERYLSLGGKVHYHTPVHKILVEDNTARGLVVRHEAVRPSDITLSAADWHFTVFEALEGKYATQAMIDLMEGRSLELFWSVVQCSFGINRDLSHLPHLTRFPLDEELVSPDSTVYPRLEMHIYHYDPTMAPPGKSTVVVSFYTRERNYWLNLRRTNRAHYRSVKNDFLERVLDRLDRRLGGIRSLVEMTDIATPATFHRYTHNWQGSVQGFLPGKHLLADIPIRSTLPGLKNFFYSSHWSVPVGGLPQAIRGARDVARRICHQSGIRMITNVARPR